MIRVWRGTRILAKLGEMLTWSARIAENHFLRKNIPRSSQGASIPVRRGRFDAAPFRQDLTAAFSSARTPVRSAGRPFHSA